MAWLDRILTKPKPSSDPVPEVEPISPLLSYQVANLQQKGARPYQEDSFAFVNALDVTEIRENGLMAIVADGMGGMEAGKQVSEMAVSCMVSAFSQMQRTGDLALQLRNAVIAADDALVQRFKGIGGTTLISCIIYDEKLYFASVGDSYLYLARGGNLYRLNREQNYRHQLYAEAIVAGSIDPTAADQDPDGHRLSAFLGMGGLSDLDYLRRPLPLLDGDILLLCSDGVGGVLTEAQIMQNLSSGSAAEMCLNLDESVRQAARVHQDNYTALVIRCEL